MKRNTKIGLLLLLPTFISYVSHLSKCFLCEISIFFRRATTFLPFIYLFFFVVVVGGNGLNLAVDSLN